MSVFREKVEPKEETEPEKKETPDVIDKTDGLKPTEDKEPNDLEVYETEKGHKFAEKYFDVRNVVAGDKIVRMEIGMIDKYIKNEIKKKGLANTVDNYSHLIHLIEAELGSERLETYKRIKKIIGYIKVLDKFNKLKELKENYATKTATN
ncbi:MAG TPA: hypothetical protein ENL05_01060 [Candidatus Moranbacteria bacterium]|nr:hypothetical protein [Candidatus Moranbacteria bacterium]